MFPSQHQLGRTLHRLRGHELRLLARQPHRHPAVRHGLEHEREEGRAGAAQGGAGVHQVRRQLHDGADAAEDPRHERGQRGGQGGRGRRDHRHGLVRRRGRVGHRAHHAAGAVRAEDGRDLRDRHAGQDADEELAVQGRAHGRLAEHGRDHLRLAGQQDDVGGGHAFEVFVLEDGQIGGQGREGGLDGFGRGRTRDAGYEASRNGSWRSGI